MGVCNLSESDISPFILNVNYLSERQVALLIGELNWPTKRNLRTKVQGIFNRQDGSLKFEETNIIAGSSESINLPLPRHYEGLVNENKIQGTLENKGTFSLSFVDHKPGTICHK
eukprot:TRINITY_DN4721_c0_g1_i3.p1 TRINITY_DN4721_c0_g1~~TRINITY_DN4721_c0_g1_i3.p1  ORF type:complete len:114 (-),score=3.16 TRINITY_DN4721_c0_g1_i3:344-685(-)